MLTVQAALLTLQKFWTDRGCMVVQPFNTEVGAGTMNPATLLRVLGPEPWRVAYVEPSVRPDDSRYGENPNRLQTHTQFQVVLKPDPGNPQELYLESLEAIGIDLGAHDVRFVEDNWAQPAIGAWGLGWEVWLDGMEVTQFTYFQQVGGQNLDPVSVELTYGIERIMMAQQGVGHFKDMIYAPGITYGEAFGQQEYEMSRYYLDEADVKTNRELFERFTTEAQRMVDARLPVPAHTFVLKSSQTFNVLDSRGAISTTERAQAFSTMRALARNVAALWVERREELDFPLLKSDSASIVPGTSVMPPFAGEQEHVVVATDASAQDFAFELGVEELPPHVVVQAIDQVRELLTAGLANSRLTYGAVSVLGTPRRIVAQVRDVSAREPDAQTMRKGPKVSAAYDVDGNPTKAAQGFARGQQVDPSALIRAEFDGAEHVAVQIELAGRDVLAVLGEVVTATVTGVRADRNMRWSDPQLAYSRPIRWVVALWGSHLVPAQVSGLRTGRTTYTQRGDNDPLVRIENAQTLVPVLAERGIVLDPEQRRAAVVEQATRLAQKVSGSVDFEAESDLVDEITNLVEQPHGILGTYHERYLKLPEQILTTVMRKHQRYLPVRAADGSLLPHFITMANGTCDDDVVREGNEKVLRARYEDAAFFYDADLLLPLADLRAGISKLTFENRLGSVAQRADRIAAVATALAGDVMLTAEQHQTLARAGELAKFDLASQMVIELSSLAGTMAREYAARAGESQAVADALAQMEQPKTASDAVPAGLPGALLALADRFDLLAAMFALGAKPTGSSDPFALRRAALGVVAILRAHDDLSSVTIDSGLAAAATQLREQGIEVSAESIESASEFVVGRLKQQLRDEGVDAKLVDAVAPLASTPGRAQAALRDIASARKDPALASLVEAVQRITRIVPADISAELDLKKIMGKDEEFVDFRLALRESHESISSLSTELRLALAVSKLPDHRGDALPQWLPDASGLLEPLARFFDEVLVMAPEQEVRAARLGLLQTIVDRAPRGIDWQALNSAL